MFIFETGNLRVVLDQRGYFTSFYDLIDGNEYLSPEFPSPLLKIVFGNQIELPAYAKCNSDTGLLILVYENAGTEIHLDIHTKAAHITFEVKDITGNQVSAILWGPYPTTIREKIGEIVGVVRDQTFAIGLQALNIKTLGGWPEELIQYGVPGYHSGRAVSELSVSAISYHQCTAVPTDLGSALQAYCRDRSHDRITNVEGIKDVPALSVRDGDGMIAGSKIALFGCSTDKILETLECIELEEGLPHPMLDGKWAKVSPLANISYLITDFTEENFDNVLSYVQKADLKYLYHPEPFQNWGHFALHSEHFPGGDDGMKKCVEKANACGIKVGVHTLSAFTTVNDPYVTPVPDDRLLVARASLLRNDIGEIETELAIESPEPFKHKMWLSAVKIGSELIQYDKVSETEPWSLKNCVRGAFGTRAQSHFAGEQVGKLWEHPYKVFFPNLELQDEYSKRLVDLFNYTGLKQISFDGLEGCSYMGHEDYGLNRFVSKWYEGQGSDVINDASRLHHFLWHINTRMNWGEPWGAAMREGMTKARVMNQDFFDRNLLPKMFGWYLIRLASKKFEATTLEDLEWALSEAAGFEAGFALSINYDVLQGHGNIDKLLNAVKQWEGARMSGAFSEDQKKRLRDVKTEWHLEQVDNNLWKLLPIEISEVYTCDPEELQPGQPGGADWYFSNPYGEQPLRFRLCIPEDRRDNEGYIENPSFIVNGRSITFSIKVHRGQYLVCDGKITGCLYDKNWNLLQTLNGSPEIPVVSQGAQAISFSCDFRGDSEPEVQIRFITMGEPEILQATKE